MVTEVLANMWDVEKCLVDTWQAFLYALSQRIIALLTGCIQIYTAGGG